MQHIKIIGEKTKGKKWRANKNEREEWEPNDCHICLCYLIKNQYFKDKWTTFLTLFLFSIHFHLFYMITFTLVAGFFCINFHLEMLRARRVQFFSLFFAYRIDNMSTQHHHQQQQQLGKKHGMKIKTHWLIKIKTARKMRRRQKRNGRRVFCGVHSFLCVERQNHTVAYVCGLCNSEVDRLVETVAKSINQLCVWRHWKALCDAEFELKYWIC